MSILNSIRYTAGSNPRSAAASDDIGLLELLGRFSDQVGSWIRDQEPNRIPFAESQYMLARIASGLGFMHKNVAPEVRRKGLFYAASCLKHYLEFNAVGWPKDGPVVASD